MKIAFVGKGGSGKSTMSALFIRYLQSKGKNVLAVDADLNMNLSSLLGVQHTEDTLLANPDVADKIRTYLRGDNSRIQDNDKFLPTTPPGKGSNVIRCVNDEIVQNYACKITDTPQINLLTVGSYDSEGIGQTCYHSHLFVAENLLSHTALPENDWVVCDMVAGTDAFAYSMYLQFDAIILIAEPSPESVEVCQHYMHLAKEAGIQDIVHMLGNKIEDEDDLAYIKAETGLNPLAYIPKINDLKKKRQRKEALTIESLAEEIKSAMSKVEAAAEKSKLSHLKRYEMLLALHEKLNAKQWVQLGYGDVMDQIDPDFSIYEIDVNTEKAA